MQAGKFASIIALALGVALAGCSKKEDASTGNTVTDSMGLPGASEPVGSGSNDTAATTSSGAAGIASPAAGNATTGTAASGAAASGTAASGAVPGDHDHAATGRVEASDNRAKAAKH